MTWIMIVVLILGGETHYTHIGPFSSGVECESKMKGVMSYTETTYPGSLSNVLCVPLRPKGSPNKEFD